MQSTLTESFPHDRHYSNGALCDEQEELGLREFVHVMRSQVVDRLISFNRQPATPAALIDPCHLSSLGTAIIKKGMWQVRSYLHSLLVVNAKYLSEDEEIFSRRAALKLILLEQQVCDSPRENAHTTAGSTA